MDDRFFTQPVLNSPYEYPNKHWELDADGQPTQQILEYRRGADCCMTHIIQSRHNVFDDKLSRSNRELKLGETAVTNEQP